MRSHPPREWFSKYKIGWGIGPNTWEGWLISIALIGVVVVIVSASVPPSH